ncbi:hypothetical protein pb186bvf_021027 [Paramecium bursaria]
MNKLNKLKKNIGKKSLYQYLSYLKILNHFPYFEYNDIKLFIKEIHLFKRHNIINYFCRHDKKIIKSNDLNFLKYVCTLSNDHVRQNTYQCILKLNIKY